METEQNKQLIRDFVSRVFVQLDAAAVNELVADDFESHSWPSPSGNPKADLVAVTERMGSVLSEIRFEAADMIGEGDRVAARLLASAKPIGEFMGMPPTGRRYAIEEIHIFRVRDGAIVEHWHQLDSTSMVTQLKGE